MACGGAQKQNADTQASEAASDTQKTAEAASETPKADQKSVLDAFVTALPNEYLAGEEWADLKKEMLANLFETLDKNPDSHFCSASVGNDEGCTSEAILTVFPKKDGKNFFCVAQCGGGCDCWVPSFDKTYNLNLETGKLTEEKPVIEAVDVEEFGPISDDAKKLMQKALSDNTLDHTYYVEYDFETGKIEKEAVKIYYNYDIQEQMSMDDWNNFVVVERYWNGEKFVKKQ